MALEEQTSSRMGKLLQVATRIHSQPRKRADGDPPKLYSVHAPEVECIAKGKARKQYEFLRPLRIHFAPAAGAYAAACGHSFNTSVPMAMTWATLHKAQS